MVDESLQRGIAQDFERQLTRGGILWPLLQRVLVDDTLSLEIRNGYVDIYYRGGRLLGIHEQANAAKFRTEFDWRYCNVKKEYRPVPPERPPHIIASADDAQAWVDAFAFYKQIMDIRFFEHPKLEREYQQAVVRDNNRHASGDASDYAVIDVEYTQSRSDLPAAKYRFDMVGFRWPAEGETRASSLVTPAILEMKAGDGALASRPTGTGPHDLSPGLVKHVRDIEGFLTPEPGKELSGSYRQMREELTRMFETKKRLNLPSLPEKMKERLTITEANMSPRPEVLFVLGSHNPTSTVLARELQEIQKLGLLERADYKVATVSYTGYALFAENMQPLDDFIAELP
jgi:hypothetical protein